MNKQALLAACVLSVACVAKAELLAYEPFDYTAGASLIGQNLGHGFSSAWIAGGNVNNSIIASGSLGYTDSFGTSIVTKGNRAFLTGDGSVNGSNTGGNNGSASPRRVLTFNRGLDSTPTTTWFSIMASIVSPPHPFTNSLGSIAQYPRGVGVYQFFYNSANTTSQGSEMFGIGRGTESSTGANLPDPTHTMDSWGIINRGSAAQEVTSDVGFASPPADFLLFRVDHNPGTDPRVSGQEDIIHLWINPANLSKAPSDAKADLVYTSATADALGSANDRDYVFNQIRLFAGNVDALSGYIAIEVDELKIGTSYLDVTIAPVPEPSTLALLGLGAIGLALLRRK